jgi:hypothetical protein
MAFQTSWGGVRQPKWLFLALGALAYAFGIPVVAFSLVTGHPDLFTLLIVCFVFGTMSLRYGLASVKDAKFTKGTISVTDDRTLSCDDRVLARAGELRQGFVIPTEDGTIVRLDRAGRRTPLYVRVRDEGEGQALLRALGFDAESVAAEMRAASSLLGMGVLKQLGILGVPVALVIAAVIGVGSLEGASVALALVGLLAAYTFTLAFAPTLVRVGTDGVLTRWLGRERFHPFATITEAAFYHDIQGTKHHYGVRLTLHNGAIVSIPTGQTDVGVAEAQRLAQRIDEARAAREHGASIAAGRPRDLLLRGRQSLASWVTELRRMGAGVHDHRHPAVPVEVLLRVVEDTTASAAERASAAVAVVSSADPEAKQRVRVAADAVASPKLRASLVRIAEAPEASTEELAASLDGLDEIEVDSLLHRATLSR